MIKVNCTSMIIKRVYIFCILLLCFCYGLSASSTHVVVPKAGKLKSALRKSKMDFASIDTLIIQGELNGTDILGLSGLPELSFLDIRNCIIVAGGKPYFKEGKNKYRTQNDILTSFMFKENFNKLRNIALPKKLIGIEQDVFDEEMNNIAYDGEDLQYCNDKQLEKSYVLFRTMNSYIAFPKDNIQLHHIGIYEGNIPHRAFQGCTSIESILLHKGVESIGEACFVDCTNLRAVSLRSAIEELPTSLFRGCKNLSYIQLPQTLRTIGDICFYGCSMLSEITLPASIQGIGNYAFAGCTSLESIIIPEQVMRIPAHCFEGCTKLTNVILPKDLMEIEECAFKECALAQIELPSSLEKLGESAFEKSNLREITIPNGISLISESCFKDCPIMEKITLPADLQEIGAYAFSGCKWLRQIAIPKNISTIGNYAFANCTSLNSVRLPQGINAISTGLFYGCYGLSSVSIPDNIKIIGEYAFKGCDLDHIMLPATLQEIKTEAFSNNSFSNIILPESLLITGDNVWKNCNLDRIDYPANIQDIGHNDFSEASGLSIIMKSPNKPYGSIDGKVKVYIPTGTYANYESWNQNCRLIDDSHIVVRTSDINDFTSGDIKYSDIIRLTGDIYSPNAALDYLSDQIWMTDCIDCSGAHFFPKQIDVDEAYETFREEEDARKSSKDQSELISLIAGGASLYADFFMDPITGFITRTIADAVKEEMDKDVQKYKPRVFDPSKIGADVTLKSKLLNIAGLRDIVLPGRINTLDIEDSIKQTNIYLLELPDNISSSNRKIILYIPERLKEEFIDSDFPETLNYRFYTNYQYQTDYRELTE